MRWVRMDVRHEAAVREGVAEVCRGSIEEVPLEMARAQLETNFFGVLATFRAVVPHMRQARSGRIVVVGSLAGRAPIPFQAHYSASKAAADNLTLALRLELEPFGVAVSLVEPGDINTPFNDAADWGEEQDSAYGERIARCEQVIRESLPKAPGPEVVARTIVRALEARRPRSRRGGRACATPLDPTRGWCRSVGASCRIG
jgi:NAD(P)-dependent dehydrogenase (short-subunit alcohol dehydrogenase family)